MLRVRGFTQDDAHIFCTPEQLSDEIAGVCELVHTILSTFGFEYKAYLATRPEKASARRRTGSMATAALREAAAKAGLALEPDEGGGAFYGPKIDFKIKDALGREWQNSTIQCDFNLPSASTCTSPTTTASTSGRSWCTAPSWARWSASSAR
jgi:threonyl-tRNA synthetase